MSDIKLKRLIKVVILFLAILSLFIYCSRAKEKKKEKEIAAKAKEKELVLPFDSGDCLKFLDPNDAREEWEKKDDKELLKLETKGKYSFLARKYLWNNKENRPGPIPLEAKDKVLFSDSRLYKKEICPAWITDLKIEDEKIYTIKDFAKFKIDDCIKKEDRSFYIGEIKDSEYVLFEISLIKEGIVSDYERKYDIESVNHYYELFDCPKNLEALKKKQTKNIKLKI